MDTIGIGFLRFSEAMLVKNVDVFEARFTGLKDNLWLLGPEAEQA